MSDDLDLPDGELLTLDKAAAEVGWTGRYRWERLQRYLVAREKQLGRNIMARNNPSADKGGRMRGMRYQVTRGALRRHCPELFETSIDVFAKSFRNTLGEIDEKIERRISEHPKILRLERGQATVQRNLNELAKRVAKLA